MRHNLVSFHDCHNFTIDYSIPLTFDLLLQISVFFLLLFRIFALNTTFRQKVYADVIIVKSFVQANDLLWVLKLRLVDLFCQNLKFGITQWYKTTI